MKEKNKFLIKIYFNILGRKRISIDFKNLSCPICGITLRPVDLKSHLETELERLAKLNKYFYLLFCLSEKCFI